MESWLLDFLNWLTRIVFRRRRGPKALPATSFALGSLGATAGPIASSPDAPAIFSLGESELDRHLHIVGASGSGKSRLLELIIREHVEREAGFCLIDPHGDLTESVVAFLCEFDGARSGAKAPFDRGRLVLIEPFREDAIVGLNPLDPGAGPLHAHIGDLVGILRRFWAGSWGPRMEELLRNALLTLAKTGYTLVEVEALLTNPEFRARVIRDLTDAVLRDYWLLRYDTLTDAARATVADPVLNKLSALFADPRIRGMLGQREGTFNFRQAMDRGDFVLVNCARGQLRDAAFLLGSFVVAQIQTSAISRADTPETSRRPYTLLVDEFQNFRGDDFETILCEARKYRLRLICAHQHLAQLDTPLQAAIFGNVGTQVFFALSPQDAAIAARKLDDGAALAGHLVHQPTAHATVARRSQPARQVRILNVESARPPADELSRFVSDIRASVGRPLAEIETEIAARTAPAPQPLPAPKRPRSRAKKAQPASAPTAVPPDAAPAGSTHLTEAPDD